MEVVEGEAVEREGRFLEIGGVGCWGFRVVDLARDLLVLTIWKWYL